ncbi:hypothetical protein [Nocardia goodfellowii]|uniref:Uncharacterized protein n=1 Tax=Nocardia goodfellowii TaxID=882446 RepID=A0ABS4QE55_9NOCA|nr:hypothetical protein [Nocardia goodfellowii]MBP2189975.1 hypothetical protein [Nocardia goodfellowii]
MADVADLTELKSRTREMGSGAVPGPIAEFIASEFDCAAPAFPKNPYQDPTRVKELTTEFFRNAARSA